VAPQFNLEALPAWSERELRSVFHYMQILPTLRRVRYRGIEVNGMFSESHPRQAGTPLGLIDQLPRLQETDRPF
jgi:hypothetical protein